MKCPDDCLAYVDGGILGRNPSTEGGTWCAIFVSADDRTELFRASGVVRPKGYYGHVRPECDRELNVPSVENNLTELIAAVQALERLPDTWKGVLFSDSQNTIRRLTAKHPKFGGVPPELYARVSAQRKRFPALKCVLLDGHPNAEQLLAGIGKRGYPVSRWNHLADQECCRLAGKPAREPARPRKKAGASDGG